MAWIYIVSYFAIVIITQIVSVIVVSKKSYQLRDGELIAVFVATLFWPLTAAIALYIQWLEFIKRFKK